MTLNKEAFREWLKSNGQIPFDIHSQNLSEWEWAQKYIPGLVVSSAGGMLPFQAEGLLNGIEFYYREEHGYARLNVGSATENGPTLPGECLYTSSLVYGDKYGCLGRDALIPFMMRLVSTLEIAPICWKFEAKKPRFIDDQKWSYVITDEVNFVYGYGHTPEEGLLAAAEPSEYLTQNGFSAEMQAKLWQDSQVNPIPVNKERENQNISEPYFQVNF